LNILGAFPKLQKETAGFVKPVHLPIHPRGTAFSHQTEFH